MKIRIALALTLVLHAGICAAADSTGEPASPVSAAAAPTDDFPMFDEMEVPEVWDPLEPINRSIFWFNDKVYFYALKPAARVLRLAPEELRISIRNFFSNLKAPVRIANAGLQGKFRISGTEMTRFFINTTLGIGGFFDPANEHFDLRMTDEDTGQTLGYWGIGSGPYLVLPFLGPSSLREAVGEVGDTTLDLGWYFWGNQGVNNYDYLGARTINLVNDTALDKDTYENIKQDSLDPYLFIRDAHAQYRRNLIKH